MNTKLRTVILLYLICCIFTLSTGYILFHNWNQERIAVIKTDDFKEQQVLRQVSKRVGRDFSDWQALREYVWCELIMEGMTRAEVLQAIQTIGEMPENSVFTDYISFSNSYLDYNLAPIILKFDGLSDDAKLVDWKGSPEQHFSAPRSSREPDLSDYE